MRGGRAWWLLGLCVAGCGDDAAAPPAADASGGDGGVVDAGPVAVAAPAEAALPVLTPCPSGWREVPSASSATTCDPWPDTGRAACGAGEAHWPGAPGCARVGSECPADGLPAGLPTDRAVFYVHASAAAGGDGSRARPFTRIAEGIAAATGVTGGAIVAVGAGRYDEAVLVPADVTVWGACTAETLVTSSAAASATGVIFARTARSGARNLTIDGAAVEGVLVSGLSADFTLEDVIVARASGNGIRIDGGGHLSATHVVVRDTVALPEPDAGHGVWARRGSRAELMFAVVEGNRAAGVNVTGGSRVVLDDIAIVDTHERDGDRSGGFGIATTDTSTVEVHRAAIEGNRTVGVFVTDDGASVTLEDSVVRDTLTEPARNRNGAGAAMQAAGRLVLRRVLFERNHSEGVYFLPGAATAQLEDVVVRDTRSAADRTFAGALSVRQGGTAEVTRLLSEGGHGQAIEAADPGTTLTISDLTVRDVDGYELDRRFGGAILVHNGASADVTRARLERAHTAGVFSNGSGSRLVMHDVTVVDTLSQLSDGLFGHGLHAEDGSTLEATRVRIEGSHGMGAIVRFGSTMQLTDLLVASTVVNDCAMTTCADGAFGSGLGVYDGTIHVTRFVIDGAALCGVHVAENGEADLTEGVVTASRIGACVQVEGYDLTRLTADVLYTGNERNLDTVMLPVPAPLPPGLGM